MSRIFITGLGVISAVGKTVADNRNSLASGKCGIHFNAAIPSRYAETLPFGEIGISDEELRSVLNISEDGVTRTTLLALHAFNEAIANAGLAKEQVCHRETALVGATTVGGMCMMDQLNADANNETVSPFASSYDCASVNLFLQRRHGLQGIVNTINTACSSSANAIMYGARLIRNGYAKRAIVGGADSLSKFTVNGFNALHILSSALCRPFDNNREGLNLGEGAAFLVLEKEEDCAGKTKYAALSGYCNSNDAYHPSSLSENGDGPFLAMEGALQMAGITPGQIDFINAHGTGTENNDEVESRAMLRLFEQAPAFASTKSNTGHTLGASGAIEAVYSILNLVNQEVYPGLNFKNEIPGTGLKPALQYAKKELQHVMSNSFGFGGNCSSLIFSKV